MVVHWISTTVLGVILVVAGFLDFSDSATSEFLFPSNTGCVCPGSVLTYTCTAVGTGNTLWRGTAFDCAANGIILRHERYTESGGAVGICNNGAIDGRSVGVENNCYTSEIAVTVSATFNNKTIQCIHNSGTGINTIGTSVITVLEAPYPQPNNVRLIDVNQEMLTFGWDPLGPNCESVVYGISTTCGSCGPASTNATTVDCFGFQLSSDVSTCTFSVNLMLCGNTGPSNIATATLKVPDIPRETITPVYSAANKTLLSIGLVLYQEESFDVVDGISGAVLSYTTYFNSGLSHTNSACGTDVCEYAVNLPLSSCISSAIVNVTVSATNRLGEGLSSDPVLAKCINQFVDVEYNPATSTILCVFLNELDTSEKSCSIRYGLCDQEQTEMAADNTTTSSVMLNLDLTSSGDRCYIIVASNRTYAVMVDGRIGTVISGNPSLGVTPVVIIVTMVLVITTSTVILILIVLIMRHKYKSNQSGANLLVMKPIIIEKGLTDKDRFTDDDLPYVKLKAVDKNEWDLVEYEVDFDCSLKEFIEKQERVFKRGCAFYEFNSEIESISEEQQLILFESETRQYFNLDTDPKELCLIGEEVLRPSLSKHKVFVQSTGLGARHLPQGSALLYMKLKQHPLWNVDPKQFKELQIKKNCTLQAFCREHQLDSSKCSMYIECDKFQQIQKIDDVIVMDKASMKLFTSPSVHDMIKHGTEDDIKQHWKVFLWSADDKNVRLKKGKKVLYKLQEQDQERQQLKLQQPLDVHCYSTKPPLLCINSERFVTRLLDRNYTFKEFRSLPSVNMDPSEGKIFVEVGWFKLDGLKIHDMILMHKATGEFYTGPSAWDEVRNHDNGSEEKHTGKKVFKAFVLCDFDDKLLLLKNTSVFYCVHKKQIQAKELVPVYSEQLMELDIERGCSISQFHKKHKLSREEHEYMFVECTDFSEHIDDVILMDKISKKFFTYPCSRLMVRTKFLTDEEGKIREEIHKRWKVYRACKPEKGFVFKEDTTVLCQDPSYYTVKFHVLKVDENNIRMSQFIKTKVGSFENGKAFYEFKQHEDLPCYKEVVHVPMSLIDRLTTEQKSETPADSKLPQCSSFSSINKFYEIPGAPGYEVRPPPSSMNKVFIQSTSQGSRCLTTGMVILYKL